MNRAIPLVLITALLAGCAEDEKPAPIRPVLYTEVQQQNEQILGRFAGNIEARVQSTLGFRVGGRVARRLVDAGAEVKAGTTLATLDPTDQQNALRASEGDQARAQAQWINAQANARRQQELFDRGVGAKANLEQAQTELSNARSNREQAEAATRQARDRVDYGTLKSDFDAVVTAWHVEAGQVVGAGQEVVTLARPDVREAVFDLPVELADGLDDQVQFNVASQLDPSIATRGRLRELAPRADAATRTRRARLTLEDTPPGLRLGTAVAISLTRAQQPRSLLPAAAVQEVDGQSRVWVIDSKARTVHPRNVQVVGREGEQISVEGLAAGDKVVSAGLSELKDGQQIRIDEGVAP
ncbi:efflux RND transporter periplasmic adaptor subunit [Pseudomonas argentinensis]|uniref:RND family efflux transporter, MFP subunit n=1 Tax=Phytopseudomonas argentinensis TaxID=289370 RepID=A0A1I3M5T5_9GAMM|nr:efflux RND transporter periplasmic adaptor subunit [Pseudomonas argentinensis]KAB0547029.1 efflux RND transporter periplasmic adaptor subunit [Pseudomonas argentinensis]SFI92318.1 RND family efflux transporter, MFP subunit [Pseudomonas argentinensis]